MRLNELLVSSVNITEDDYDYKGLFTLSGEGKSQVVDLADMDTGIKLDQIKDFFELEEPTEQIKKLIMDQVYEKAALSSRNIEGKEYSPESNAKSIEKSAGSLDRA